MKIRIRWADLFSVIAFSAFLVAFIVYALNHI